jgi:hypothetical protein
MYHVTHYELESPPATIRLRKTKQLPVRIIKDRSIRLAAEITEDVGVNLLTGTISFSSLVEPLKSYQQVYI